MATDDQQAQAILDSALRLAEQSGWEQLRLSDVAADLSISLDDIRRHYRQKDDLVEAWFDGADRTMLEHAETEGFLEQAMPQRLEALIMAWFNRLAGHKRLTGQMLLYKLEPGHIHLQAAGVLRVSRTVQWFREAAQQDSTDLMRILEEIGLSSIFVASFVYWLNDSSEGQTKTRRFLKNKLHKAGYCVRFWRSLLEPSKPDTEAKT